MYYWQQNPTFHPTQHMLVQINCEKTHTDIPDFYGNK